VHDALDLPAGKKLVRPQVPEDGKVVFDPRTERQHHLIDVPWYAVRMSGKERLRGSVRECRAVMRGRRRWAGMQATRFRRCSASGCGTVGKRPVETAKSASIR